MSHFAYISEIIDGKAIVEKVIVIEQDEINSGRWGDPSRWIQTSYNTHGGIHYQPNSDIPSDDQSKALRGNYAAIGFIYDAVNDVFYEQKPYNSWTLNESTWTWEPPVPYPNDGKQYAWNDSELTWVERTNLENS